MRKDKDLKGDLDRLPMLASGSSRREEAPITRGFVFQTEPRHLGCYDG